ncbi:MAG: DUF1501 domain-containing protein [Alphaproteobacteria bacterium]|nr:DUF1501 domain-containing protein [Alphaproteobacteria bacterium]MBU1512649.1 DUF1501 domain-containing protein [Alphaproteobacteria bacterium]MBU2095043.1 DUF1501 domain-containing protein [Alphaproteobacteria bacterium]MBU2151838.1 DUF1501 domain-containing protein [Alphaproteobacteria bacterium]MBU2306237.1 DUF1501 domain-containing protein [Alphaproteobacteria bacterium]
MNAPMLSRRAFAAAGLALPFLARVADAAVPANKKFVVIICRGGMDGLSVAAPVGDPDYAALRGGLALGDTALKLDGTFALNPALANVHKLALAGEARIAPAVATPDRARSHFEAQDVLETGAAGVYATTSGWLNRSVQAMSAAGKIEAISVGPTAPLILRGPAPAASWSPGRGVDTAARLPMLLQDLYKDDPLLGPALARGLITETMARDSGATDDAMGGGMRAGAAQGAEAARALGEALAGFLKAPGGPQLAAVSLDGFDTHANQAGLLSVRLTALDALVDGLHTGLGPAWKDTVVLAVTEFGRTARVNGTGGTDHGTGSTALILGGGLKTGGIVGDWPTLKRQALFEDRDVYPALDLRALEKGLLAEHMGLDRRMLDTAVFPDSEGVRPLLGLV